MTIPSFVRYQLPAILWATVIFISSSIPADSLPEVAKMVGFDKVIHFFVFLILCAITHRAIKHQSVFPFLSRHHFVFSVLLTVSYGVSDEFHQAFVPSRNSSVFDLFADTLGGCLYVGVFWVLSRGKRFKMRP